MGIVKDEARKLIDQLPEQATWDDIMYQLYIRKKIDKGLEAIKEGQSFLMRKLKRGFFNEDTMGRTCPSWFQLSSFLFPLSAFLTQHYARLIIYFLLIY